MPFIGLTGNFGMGKTTVLKFFKNSGAYTINADKLVSDILKRRAIIKKLSAVLGSSILTKKGSKVIINKKRMADIIFSDPRMRTDAERIIHPEVIKIAKNIKKRIFAQNPNAVIVCEVPLLFEGGYRKIFDKVAVVYCSKAKAIERLRKRGFSKAHILKRMRAQLPISQKKASADFVINNSDFDNIRPQVRAILRNLKQI